MSDGLVPMVLQQHLAILNCRVTFNCPKLWSELAPTADPAIRACATCSQNVFRCDNPDELEAHVKAGHCVAVLSAADAESRFVGQIKTVYNPAYKLNPSGDQELAGMIV